MASSESGEGEDWLNQEQDGQEYFHKRLPNLSAKPASGVVTAKRVTTA